MKKGATHVDWAISMGIFLVYVLLMFIFLKPTSQPVYSGDALLDTVYSGLKNDTTFTIQRGYFVIRPTISISSDTDYKIRIKGASKYLGKGWKESEKQWEDGLQTFTRLTMFNGSLKKVPSQYLSDAVAFDFKNEQCEPHCSEEDKDVLDITTRLENNEDNIFWFVYSEDETYSHSTTSITYDDDTCQLEEGDPPTRTNPCLLNDGEGGRTDDFTYEFGMIETYSGFSERKLDDLKANYPDSQGEPSDGYKNLKKAWHFPEDKNFQIKIEGV